MYPLSKHEKILAALFAIVVVTGIAIFTYASLAGTNFPQENATNLSKLAPSANLTRLAQTKNESSMYNNTTRRLIESKESKITPTPQIPVNPYPATPLPTPIPTAKPTPTPSRNSTNSTTAIKSQNVGVAGGT